MITMTKQFAHKKITTPSGKLTLISNGSALAAILWENDSPERVRIDQGEQSETDPILIKAEKQLLEYYAGCRTSFDLPLDFQGSDFQKAVWKALLSIPYGETKTYKQIATELGKEQAVRAVGTAIGRNPLSIVAPCHRVIGSDGELRGFAGGLETKAQLLKLESETSVRRK